MNATAIARSTAIGAVSGLAASAIMNGFQASWSAARKQLAPGSRAEGGGEPSTVKAADRVSRAATGKPVPEPQKDAAGEAMHFGFGGLLGALYGGSSAVLPHMTRGFGLPFGTAVWALADEAAVPAAGLSEPPQQAPLSTHAYSLVSHLVFGAALEVTRRVLAASADRAFGSVRQAR